MRNQEGVKIQLQEKVHKRICVRDITVLTARLSFFLSFVVFFIYSLPLPKWRICWRPPGHPLPPFSMALRDDIVISDTLVGFFLDVLLLLL